MESPNAKRKDGSNCDAEQGRKSFKCSLNLTRLCGEREGEGGRERDKEKKGKRGHKDKVEFLVPSRGIF